MTTQTSRPAPPAAVTSAERREQYAKRRQQGYTPWEAVRIIRVTSPDLLRAAAAYERQYQAGGVTT